MNNFKKSQNPFSGGTEDYCSGNGSIMRLAPVPMRYALSDQEKAITESVLSSQITHGGVYAVDCCKILAIILTGFLRGELNKEELFSRNENNYVFRLLGSHTIDDKVKMILLHDYNNLPEDEVRSSAFSVDSLEAALWSFCNTNTFESGALKAVNLGDDADTVGAIYGQIAGAYYGVSGIPEEWLKLLSLRPLIEAMTCDLLEFAEADAALEQSVKPFSKAERHIIYAAFDSLEEEYEKIYTRVSPGPKMYKQLTEFAGDCAIFSAVVPNLITSLNEKRPEVSEHLSSALIDLNASFVLRLEKANTTVTQRLNRPTFSFAKKAPIK